MCGKWILKEDNKTDNPVCKLEEGEGERERSSDDTSEVVFVVFFAEKHFIWSHFVIVPILLQQVKKVRDLKPWWNNFSPWISERFSLSSLWLHKCLATPVHYANVWVGKYGSCVIYITCSLLVLPFPRSKIDMSFDLTNGGKGWEFHSKRLKRRVAKLCASFYRPRSASFVKYCYLASIWSVQQDTPNKTLEKHPLCLSHF